MSRADAPAARRPHCPACRSADVYRLRDHRRRLLRTRPPVYGCESCCSAFTAPRVRSREAR